MKIFKHLGVVIILSVLSQLAYSQSDDLMTELPAGNKEAYIQSEPKLINTINWLDNTPIDKDVEVRQKQMALLLAWLTNSPTVTIELHSYVLPFTKKNPELLLTFMGGWTKYSLENSYSKDNVACNTAGIKSIVAFYRKGSGLKKDKKLQKLVELDDRNELENWVAEQLGKK
jgi:hypothetical protein